MGKYCDVSHDGMEAYTTYGDAEQGNLYWGGGVLPLIVDDSRRLGIFLSFAFVDNPSSIYYGKHIAYMQDITLPNTGIFCVCEDGQVILLPNASYGTNPGIVTRNGDLIYTVSGFTYNDNGIPKQIPLAEGTSQGIAYVDGGQITWMDTVIGDNSPIYGGYKFVRAYKVGNWVFGQSAYKPIEILAYEISTGKVYLVNKTPSEVAPRGNDVFGRAICAISEPGLFVYQEQFTLLSEPTQPPVNPPVDTFKQGIINKLPMQLNHVEIEYLIQLVNNDM